MVAFRLYNAIDTDHAQTTPDLRKFNTVAWVMNSATRRHAFATAPAKPHDFPAARIGGTDPARTLVGLEACDCPGWVHDPAAAVGCAGKVANCRHDA